MKAYKCPHCGQSHFATLCTDCLAEGIRIQETRSIFHLGRCHRCGHVDDEPCTAQIGSGEMVSRAWQSGGSALRGLTEKAATLAARAADAIKAHSNRPR